VTEFIDPEELPFTHAEIYAAAQTFLPGEAARQMADHLVACGPDLIAARSERRAGWLLAGVANAERRLLHAWVILMSCSQLSRRYRRAPRLAPTSCAAHLPATIPTARSNER